MFPVLFTIGNFPVSSFGLFLALGIFFGSFTVWRIARSFDYDSEKVLDLIFLTVGIGFVTARLTFVLLNLQVFDSLTKIFFIIIQTIFSNVTDWHQHMMYTGDSVIRKTIDDNSPMTKTST